MRSKLLFLYLIISLVSYVSIGQDDTIADIQRALSASSSKELIKYCVDRVEIDINGSKAIYSRAQAEIIFREFFDENIALNFNYVHQGASPEGLKYTIGNYAVDEGSYRVFMLLKQETDQYLIDQISFTRQ
jgi:hypothetical protein